MSDNVPYPIAWKRAFLKLEATIEEFVGEWLEDRNDSNVLKLLSHHLALSAELLRAHVNGGLEESYQDEADNM